MTRMDMMQGYDPAAFAAAVHAYRRRKRLTQAELAHEIGCSPPTICRVEQKGTVNVLVFKALLQWMGRKAEDFDTVASTAKEDGRGQMFQHLETAMKLREDREALMDKLHHLYKLTRYHVIRELMLNDKYVYVDADAEIEERVMKAHEVYLVAKREFRHSSDTVELVEAEIRLWEKGRQ